MILKRGEWLKISSLALLLKCHEMLLSLPSLGIINTKNSRKGNYRMHRVVI